MIYFTSAMGTIYFLVRVIIPRIRKHKIKTTSKEVVKDEVINPTFFAWISQFRNSDEYAIYLRSIAKDENKLYEMFASQVFALGKINQRKNENVRLSLFFFITALISELLIIMSMAYSRALPYLFPTGWNIPYQFLYLLRLTLHMKPILRPWTGIKSDLKILLIWNLHSISAL